VSRYICYGHCFLEFPNQSEFSKHCLKVVEQREKRRVARVRKHILELQKAFKGKEDSHEYKSRLDAMLLNFAATSRDQIRTTD
jgi:hypothetical protein